MAPQDSGLDWEFWTEGVHELGAPEEDTCEQRPAHTLGLGGPVARLGGVEDGADFLETGRKLVTRVSPALWPAALHPGPPGCYSRGVRPIRASLFLLLIGFAIPSSSCSWVAKVIPRFV